MYRISHLTNGLTLATAEMPHMSSVSVGLWVGIGSRYEPAEMNGICHFIEHMLFKGTKKRSAKAISQKVEGLGGYLNAFTGEETTCFHARASCEHFEELVDVLMDMFPHLSGYLRDNYVSGNTLLVTAGKLTHRHVVKCMARYARRIGPGARPEFVPARNAQSGARIHLHTKDTEQTQVALGLRTCGRHDERRYALRLLNAILGESMSSRLFQVVREDHGLAYSIYSSPSYFHDTGDLVISAGLETDNLTRTLRLIAQELRRLIGSPPSAAELRRARDYVIGQMELTLESTDNQMNWLGEQLLGFGRIFRPVEIKRRLRQVTPSAIRSAARDFFRPERLNLALVSPLKSDKHLAKSLRL